jgi:alkylation response protein AidB-like acyl-CoA dehydrogenase
VKFLDTARSHLNECLPGLDKRLADHSLEELERPDGAALSMFREAGGAAMLIPSDLGGRGVSLADAVQVQRAIGARSPSLAVATTMHHFSVASLVALAAQSSGLEWAMLEAISANGWLVSSAFAEGKTGHHILSPTMRGTRVDDGIVVSGVKKPCSLTWSMDLLSASVSVADPATGEDRMAVILVPASTPGIERHKFWQNWVLAGAESDEVRLIDVHVPDALVFYPQPGQTMDPIHARGFASFELLVAASYLGVASALAERVLLAGKGHADERVGLVIELEAATAAVSDAASDDASDLEAHLAGALFARFNAQQAAERVAAAAAGLAGGMAFVASSDISYLLAASRALAFHPPSRGAASEALIRYLAGDPLVL